MATLEEMASRGYTKMSAKASQMKTSWEGAKSRMKANYAAQPFGPTRTSNYSAGIDRGVYRVDADKWKKNWLAKMAE